MRWLVAACFVSVAVAGLTRDSASPPSSTEAALREVVLAPAPENDLSETHVAPDEPAGQRTRFLSGLSIAEATGATAQQHFERELDPDAGSEEFTATALPP